MSNSKLVCFTTNPLLPSLHQKTGSHTSLKSLLDYKQSSVTPKLSPNNNSLHTPDSARQSVLQRQLQEKRSHAGELFSEFLEQQRERKRTREHLGQPRKVPQQPPPPDETFEDLFQILERFSDINLNTLTAEVLNETPKDRRLKMVELQRTIRHAVEKGYYENSRTQTQKLYQEMKHSNPHYFTTEPAGRLDAVNLRLWLAAHLAEIQQISVDHKEKLNIALDSLFICLNELIRQVSYNCVERGQLIMAVFKGYMAVFKKAINMNEQEKQSQKIQSYKTELESQMEFEQILSDKDSAIQMLKLRIRDDNKKLQEQLAENNTLSATIKNLEKTIDLDRSIKKTAAALISNLNREIAELRQKINRVHVHSQTQGKKLEEEVEELDVSLTDVLKEVDQKTYVEVNPDIVVVDVVDEPPKITFSAESQTEQAKMNDQFIQCNLNLVDPSFDKIMIQKELENCVQEYELKEQVGIYTNQQFGIMSEPHQKITQRQSLLRILDGLPGNMDQLKQMNKHDMLDLFLSNVKQLRQALDREEEYSEADSIDEDEKRSTIRESRDFIEIGKATRTKLSEESQEIRTSRAVLEPQEPAGKGQVQLQQQGNESAQKISDAPWRSQEGAQKTQDNQPRGSKATSGKKDSEREVQVFHSKFGLTKSEQIQLKTQVSMLITLYNIQTQKTQNLTSSVNQMAELMHQVFAFVRRLMIHLLKTQRNSHKQIVEQFYCDFEAIRKLMPVEIDKEIQESEYMFTEADEEEEKEKRRQQQFKKRKNKITKALVFNFQQKPQRQTVFDKLMHPGVVLALKAREQSYLFKKVVSYWPLKNVLRTITQVYDEKIRSGKDNSTAKDMDMQVYTFNNFLNRYGFKTVAEKKYLQFLLSVIHFASIFRVNVFARMIAILREEQLNFSVEESTFFLQGLEFMSSESTLGVNIVQSESDQKYHVPYLRALDYMKVYLENKMNEDELRELRQDLEALKEVDPKNLNKAGIVDVDVFLIKVITKYRIITQRTKQFVIHAFQAADLDGNKKINHNEFITLMRHIEPQRFNFKEAMDLFDDQADILDGEEKNLSFNRYTSLCVNQQIFTEATLNHFIEISSNEQLTEQIEKIKQEWTQYKEEILHTLKELQPFVTPEIFSEWNKILKTLEERIEQNTDPKPVLIAHKILRLELKRLLTAGHDEIDDID